MNRRHQNRETDWLGVVALLPFQVQRKNCSTESSKGTTSNSRRSRLNWTLWLPRFKRNATGYGGREWYNRSSKCRLRETVPFKNQSMGWESSRSDRATNPGRWPSSEVEGHGAQAPEQGTLGKPWRHTTQQQRRKDNAATEQRVRRHRDGSDELEGSDSGRKPGARSD